MSHPLTQLHRLASAAVEAVVNACRRLLDRLKAAWQRHLDLMDDREAYRAQIAAAVAAVVAVFELDPRAAAVLLALLGLHAAAFGHGPRSLRARTDFDDDRWNPFN